MNSSRLEKQKVISGLKSSIEKSSSVVAIQYHGLNVYQIQELRKQLKAHGCDLAVYKNTLFKIAANQAGVKMDKIFDGPNVYAFGYTESVTPFKIIKKFIEEEAPMLKFKAAIFEGNVVNAKEAEQIATLPSKEEALGILARSLIAPLQQMAISLNLLVTENKLS